LTWDIIFCQMLCMALGGVPFSFYPCNKLKRFKNCDMQIKSTRKLLNSWLIIMASYHNSAIQGNIIRISQASNTEKGNKLTCMFA